MGIIQQPGAAGVGVVVMDGQGHEVLSGRSVPKVWLTCPNKIVGYLRLNIQSALLILLRNGVKTRKLCGQQTFNARKMPVKG
jgi:hypothetical protein